MSRIVLAWLFCVSAAAWGAIEPWEFDSEQERQRYLRFAEELRCPKCQNQNLADSNAPIAADLRAELHRLLWEGRTDQEIVDFMVSRYGDYVLYKPPIEPRTWLLWGAPAGMLIGGVLVLAGLVRRSRAAVAGGGAVAPLDERERARLAALLDEDDR